MLRLVRRVQRLEVQLTDGSGLKPHSPEWQAHWEQRLTKILSSAKSGEPGSIPLEVWDAVGNAGQDERGASDNA